MGIASFLITIVSPEPRTVSPTHQMLSKYLLNGRACTLGKDSSLSGRATAYGSLGYISPHGLCDWQPRNFRSAWSEQPCAKALFSRFQSISKSGSSVQELETPACLWKYNTTLENWQVNYFVFSEVMQKLLSITLPFFLSFKMYKNRSYSLIYGMLAINWLTTNKILFFRCMGENFKIENGSSYVIIWDSS